MSNQNDAWTQYHLHMRHYNRRSAIYVQYCPISFALYGVQCSIRRQPFNIQRNIIDSRILTINQIKYRMMYVLRSFCGCNYSKNCSQCIHGWNHNNCTIICLVCVVLKRFLREFWLDVSIVLIDMIINQSIDLCNKSIIFDCGMYRL